jgi:glycosyltransferase involved in cell wall biosynthesis
MSNKLHILFLPRWYPHRNDKMFGLFVKRHAEAAALHHDVSVVYVHAESRVDQKTTIDRQLENGVLAFRIYYKQSGLGFGLGKLVNAIRFLMANFKGIKEAKGERGSFHLVHAHVLTRLALIALWLKWTKGIPYVITEHWSRYLPRTGSYSGRFRKWATKVSVSKAAWISTVTKNLADAMHHHGLHNMNYRILPNVVDVALFRPHDKPRKEVTQFLHISCFEDRSKNVSGILRVLGRLKAQRTDFHCTMVGDGEDFTWLKQLAYELGLAPEHLKFTGVLEGETLVNELARADYMLMFSHYENLPVVIPESFACGVPVISSRVGGIAEVVNDTNGILVEPGDEEALLQVLSNALDHKFDFDIEAMRQLVVQQNSMQHVGLLLGQWYREVVNR